MTMKTNQNRITNKQWVKSLTEKKSLKNKIKQRELQKVAQPGNRRQDESRPVLENLLAEGYDTVIWDSSGSICPICRELHHQQWTLEDFLSGLMHDAPIFEKSHPGDTSCFLIITGPDLPNVSVDSYGNVGTA